MFANLTLFSIHKINMTVLITGIAGFLGSHLAKTLVDQGHTVLGIDDYSTGINQFDDDDYGDIRVIQMNIAERKYQTDWVMNAYLTQDIDVIVHYAATVGVKNVMEKPTETIYNNIDATHFVLELARLRKIPVWLASTSEVYGLNTETLNEYDSVVFGQSKFTRWSYALSKYIDEVMAFDYAQRHGVHMNVLRFFNVTGPGQLSDYGMVIPKFIESALSDETIIVHGDGQQTRSFTHISDVTTIVAKLITEHEKIHDEVINIGNPSEITINDLVEMIIEETGSSSRVEHVDPTTIYGKGFTDMRRRCPSVSKLECIIGEYNFKDVREIICDILLEQQQ